MPDAKAARQKVDDMRMDLSPAARAELEAVIAKGESGRDPVAAFNHWMERHPTGQPVPEAFWAALDHSYTFRTEETIRWLDSLQPGPIRDAAHERGTRLLASRGQFDKAAGYVDGIADAERKANATAILKMLWSEEDPEKAEVWLRGR